jgi:hypothetical protein
MLGNGLTTIGNGAFGLCTSLTAIVIPNGVSDIKNLAFQGCSSLSSVMFGSNVSNIGDYAFSGCAITNITFPKSIAGIGLGAFIDCPIASGIYFDGNAPNIGSYPPGSIFSATNAICYYLPGTTGWGSTFDGIPTQILAPQIVTKDVFFGVRTNQFGFNITSPTNVTLVVQACTNLLSPIWQPLQTISLTNNSAYFSDPQWTNYPGRFYRLNSP